jgi:hypothetical protein
MRTAIILATVTALIVAAAVLAFVLMVRLDFRSGSYATFAEAQTAGLFRGWLPANVPPSAYDFSEVHDVSSNDCCARFRLSPADVEAFGLVLRVEGYGPAANPEPPPAYFASYRRPCPFDTEAARASPTVLRSRSVDSGSGKAQYFVLLPESGTVYYWTAGR